MAWTSAPASCGVHCSVTAVSCQMYTVYLLRMTCCTDNCGGGIVPDKLMSRECANSSLPGGLQSQGSAV